MAKQKINNSNLIILSGAVFLLAFGVFFFSSQNINTKQASNQGELTSIKSSSDLDLASQSLDTTNIDSINSSLTQLNADSNSF